jgi:hypothetical protein
MWLNLLHIWSETCYAWKICFYVKNPIYAKFYPCFMILMVSSHIYILFFKTCSCATHIYILLAIRQNRLNINFFRQFLKFPKLSRQFSLDLFGLWTGHVQLLAQTCPNLGFPAYIRGAERPPRILGLFFLFHSISCGSQGFSRWFWVFSTKSLRFLEDLTSLLLRIFKPKAVLSLSQGILKVLLQFLWSIVEFRQC